MWVTPRLYYDGNPFIHISASYGTVCQPDQRLSEFGPISIGEQYHIHIRTNKTFTTVAASSSTSSPSNSKSGIYTFPRDAPTQSGHLGRSAGIWFMSGKFGSTEYNRGNGTFSNIILNSRHFNSDEVEREEVEGADFNNMFSPSFTTTAAAHPHLNDTNHAMSPVFETTISQFNDGIADSVETTKSQAHHVTTSDAQEWTLNPVLLVGLLIIVVLILVLCIACCIVAYLCGQQSRPTRIEKLESESKMDWTARARGTGITEMDRLNLQTDVRVSRMSGRSMKQLAVSSHSAISIPDDSNHSNVTATITPPFVGNQEEDSVMAVADNLQLVMLNMLHLFICCTLRHSFDSFHSFCYFLFREKKNVHYFIVF